MACTQAAALLYLARVRGEGEGKSRVNGSAYRTATLMLLL